MIWATRRLSLSWRCKIVLGYAILHLVSWFAMHWLALDSFRSQVMGIHSSFLASISAEIAEYKVSNPNPDPEDIRSIQAKSGRVFAQPRHSFWSVSPIPFILVTSENYRMGSRWGLGMTKTYVWIVQLKCIYKKRDWMS
jgi:hypothetical protein